MIRIAIVADTIRRARQFATLLEDDERLEIVEVHAREGLPADARIDVVVTVGLSSANASHYRAPVVLISDGKSEFGRNIRAVLPFTTSASQISAAIESAANDLTVFTPEQMLRWIPTNHNRIDEETAVEELTPRELQVLRMMADGHGNREIALTLSISEHTVKFHVAQILAKLNAGGRTEAVSLGIRRGLIPV